MTTGRPRGENALDSTDTAESDKPAIKYDEESPNLVVDFSKTEDGQAFLDETANKVVRDHDEAWESSEEYRDRYSRDWKIFAGDLPKKTYPFQDCANPHVPFMVENITRNVFRAYSELFGDWDDVFGVVPLGPEDEEMANLLSLHGNWQIREQIPDFARQQFRGMLSYFSHGDVSSQSFWDPEREQNRHEILTADDFVVPYAFVSTMPDWSDVPFYIRILKLYRHQIEAREDWENKDLIFDEERSMDDEPERKISRETAKGQGIDPDETPKSAAPYTILWYEGWLKLPNQKKDRFCRVVVDYKSKAVLQLLIMEEPDWQDVQRFESQLGELEEYRAGLVNYQQQVSSLQMQIDQQRQFIQANRDVHGALQTMEMEGQLQQAEAQIGQIQPPVPPSWMENPDDLEERPEPPTRKPVYLFRHAVLIEPLVGNLGLGYGRSQADYNRCANTMLAQGIDAATFANIKSFLTTDLVEFPEKATIEPGKMTKVGNITGAELKDNIMPLDFGPPSPALFQTVDKLREYASSEMQAPAVLSGDPGKSGETFRGIQARIEQATKQLSVGTRKYALEMLHGILINNALLNSKFLREEELFHIAKGKGMLPEQLKVGRRMYERSYHIEIRADLRFASQSTRVQEADELLMLAKQVPQLAQDVPFMYAAVKRCLVARGREDMLPYLGPAPAPPQTTLGIPPPAPPQPQPVQGQPQPGQAPAQMNGSAAQGAPRPMAPMPQPAMARGV